MPHNELNTLRTRVINDLCAAMEFKAFTQLAYNMATSHCNCANSGPGVILGYAEFAHSLGLPDKTIATNMLPQHFSSALDGPFLSLVHQQQIVIFESGFFDLLKILLMDQPLRLPSKKQIEYATIVSARTKEDLIESLVERELNELKYKAVSEWFAYINRLVSACRVSDEDAGRIAEAKATRDLLVHNAGIVNGIYMQKAGFCARFSIGETVSVGGAYTLDVWQVLSSVLIGMIDAAIQVVPASHADA